VKNSSFSPHRSIEDAATVKNLSISLHDGADFPLFLVKDDVTVGKFSISPHVGADFPSFYGGRLRGGWESSLIYRTMALISRVFSVEDDLTKLRDGEIVL
jgi:hypothetical protein